jgi:hypothetical protein
MSTRSLSKAILSPSGVQSEMNEKRRGLEVSCWTSPPSGLAVKISRLFVFGISERRRSVRPRRGRSPTMA